MSYQYTIEDLSRECQVSKQSIYNLISKNKDFVNENSRKSGRKIKYNQAVLNLFLEYYGKKESETAEPEAGETAVNAENAAQEAPEKEAGVPVPPEDKTASESKIEALLAEIADLKKQLAEKEEERKELIRQNGALILTIQQQQQEKMLLLPAPKKTMLERLRGIFGKKPDEAEK